MSFGGAKSYKKFKAVFLGETNVGKTSLIAKLMYDTFEESHQPTIGVDFMAKTLYLEDRTVRLELWDTAGQERFRALTPSYIRDSAIAVIVFDITNVNSFVETSRWINCVREERSWDVIIFLVGNKSDLSAKRKITRMEGQNKATELDAVYFETTCLEGESVKNLFHQIAMALPILSDEVCEKPPMDVVALEEPADEDNQNNKKRKCCKNN